MKLTFLAFLMATLLSCGKKNDITSEPPPIIDDPRPLFSKRGAPAVVDFNGKLWLIGGAEQLDMKNDVWSSEDGVQWKLETEHAAFSPRYSHQVVKHNNKLWLIGGGLADGSHTNDVWSSADGITWIRETSNGTFSPRGYHQVAIFKDKFWMTGGITEAGIVSSDIWTSTDGKTWTPSGTLPFAGRAFHSVINYKGKLWILGGVPNANGDVWSSEDGITWTLQTARTEMGFRVFQDVVVFKDELWLIGGQTEEGRNEAFGGRTNDLWSSSDGINWNRKTASATFAPRKEQKSIVFKDKIFVIAGDVGRTRDVNSNMTNEVWFSTNGVDWEKGR